MKLGLNGSHLLKYGTTLLGDEMLIDTRGTGKRASQINGRDVAERLGEIEMIPAGRIDVTPDRLPGRLWIRVRRTDPWTQPLTHPAVDPGSPYAEHVTEPATIRKPLVIGADPETGKPLTLPVWEPDEGGRVVGIFAKKGSGKTVLLSNITERVTACPDARLIQVNLGKHREDRRWMPLAAVNALGRKQAKQAQRTLKWVVDAIEERSNSGDDAFIIPTPETPFYLIKIDEIDQVAADPTCRGICCPRSPPSAGRRHSGWSSPGSGAPSGGWAAQTPGPTLTLRCLAGSHGPLRPAWPPARRSTCRTWAPTVKAILACSWWPSLTAVAGTSAGGCSTCRTRPTIDKIVARRAANLRAHVPEPALGGLADAWAKITGDDEDQDDDGGRPTASARPVEDIEQITAKIGQARALAGDDPDLPEIPPEMAAHAADQLAERRRQFMDTYTDVTLPEPDQQTRAGDAGRPGRYLHPGRSRRAALVAYAGASAAAALAARRRRRTAWERLRPALAPH